MIVRCISRVEGEKYEYTLKELISLKSLYEIKAECSGAFTFPNLHPSYPTQQYATQKWKEMTHP